ncbi:MAG: hypothetical protein J6O56_01330 [Bacilli bacterium]|nr:hypothetical protein [Bacilli bacterium]
MKISLATNFDNELIDKIKKYPIYEVYGKLNFDLIGGGRPTNYLKNLDVKKFEDHVKKVREAGINFNYLFNSACLENMNQNSVWVNEVIDFISYLKKVGVNHLTITSPHLLELVKKYFKDDFIIRISSFACIDNYTKAKYWDELGADILCLDFCKVNRNFKMLKYMVENLNCKIELLCTNSCLKDCPMIHTHVVDLAHASNGNNSSNKYEDWGLMFCQQYQLNNIEEYIKSPWIRPEDIEKYEKIGIEHFKITERDFKTDDLVKRVEAYVNRNYNGNLLDMIQGSGLSYTEKTIRITKEFHSRKEVLDEICRVRGIGRDREFPRHVYIDNKKIPDNFIDFFVNNGCSGLCNDCQYCKRMSEKVIKKDEEVVNYLNYLYNLFNDMKY